MAAPLAFFCAVLVIGVAKDGPVAGLHDWAQGLGLIVLFILPASYLATWVLGLPYICWLRSSSHLSKWNVCLGAVVIGVTSTLVWELIANVGPLRPEQMAFGALISSGLSLCVALAFCWIVRVPS
ncbi:MAG: hypothetical protein ABI114_13470 [Rhodanobacter sp.]